jgi:ATP-dependent protease ClpP protease subunit
MAREDAPPKLNLPRPHARLLGTVGDVMVDTLERQLESPPDGDEPLVIELTTLGGGADSGRRAMLAVELARERLAPRRLVFHGKTTVYSAGVTLMSGFPREDRYLTEDATLLIHCRQLDQSLSLSGPLRSVLPQIQGKLQEVESGIELEVKAFEKLIADSDVTMDELLERALYNWYVPAKEAVERGLVAAIA